MNMKMVPPKRQKSVLVKPIIKRFRPAKDEIEASEYINHICHNTAGD